MSSIDQQHKRLFEAAARFHDAIVANKGKEALYELLASLVRYTEGHYLVEERLMKEIDFPEHAQHKAHDQALRKQLLTFQKRFYAGETVTVQVLQFLPRWLVGHTSSRDRQFGEYYRMKKQSAAPSA